MNPNYEKERAEKIEFFRAQAEQYNFTREFNKAMEYYIRAGLLGDRDSIEEVCAKVRSGYGMSYNYDEFFRCMKVGADMGITEAMIELAICYGSGMGTEADHEQVVYWLEKAAAAGSKEAKKKLEGKQTEK